MGYSKDLEPYGSFNPDLWLSYFKPNKIKNKDSVDRDKSLFNKLFTVWPPKSTSKDFPSKTHLAPGVHAITKDLSIILPFHIHKIQNDYYLSGPGKNIIGRFVNPGKDSIDLQEIKNSAVIRNVSPQMPPEDAKLLYQVLKKNPKTQKFIGGSASWYHIGNASQAHFASLPPHVGILRHNNKIWLTEPLGDGSFGKVVKISGEIKLDSLQGKAQVELYEKPQALKKMKLEAMRVNLQETADERKNIKTVHDFSSRDVRYEGHGRRKVALTMPLFDGKTVDTIQFSSRAERLAFALQLAESLEKLHEKEIVHLDIKPPNIMYDKTTQRLALIDVGHSAKVGENVPAIGSPLFMAPEICTQLHTPGNSKGTIKTDFALDTFPAAATIGGVFEGNHKEKVLMKARFDHCKSQPHRGIDDFYFERPEYKYDFSATELLFPEARSLLESMTDSEPSKRPNDKQIVSQLTELFQKLDPRAYEIYKLTKALNALAENIRKEIPEFQTVKNPNLPFYRQVFRKKQNTQLKDEYDEIMSVIKTCVSMNPKEPIADQVHNAQATIDKYLAQEKNKTRKQQLEEIKATLQTLVPEPVAQKLSKADTQESPPPDQQRKPHSTNRHRHHHHHSHRHPHRHNHHTSRADDKSPHKPHKSHEPHKPHKLHKRKSM